MALMNRRWLWLLAPCLCSVWHPSAAQTSSSVPNAEDDGRSRTELADIVVTATRRKTSLQKTPASVAVLDGDLQRDRGQQRLEDIPLSVPNVSFTNTSNSSQLYIRGVGNTFINSGGDPGVAFYQDGAYVSDQRTTNTSMFDIDRVEVLRGPQGALYGRNAVGGAINVLSAKPTSSPDARVDLVFGDRGRVESQGFASGPITDGVAARLAYQVRRYDGYTRNLLANRDGAPDRFDDLSSQAVRGQLAIDLPNAGTVTLLGSYFDEDDAGPALTVVPIVGIIYPTEALTGLRPTRDPRRIFANAGFNRLKVTTFNARLVQPIGGVTLTVVANQRNGDQRFLSDCDGTAALTCSYATDTISHDTYTEAYLSSGAGAFRWTLGGTYGRLRQRQRIDVPWQSLLSYFVPGAPADAPFPITYIAGGRLTVESFALYGDARLQVTPMFAVTGQLRYSNTVKRGDEFQSIREFGVDVASFPNHVKNQHLPFKLGVEAQLTPDLFAYAAYATANKDGAINIGALQTRPVEKETVRSWEAGVKSNFLDRRLQVNGAVFTSDYSNLQITQIIGTIATLANAPRSTVTGGEIEIVALPTSGLRLSASGGYLHATFDEFSNARTIPGAVPGPVENVSGNRLPFVPRLSGTLDASYSFAASRALQAKLGVQVSYRARIFFNEFNDRDNSAPPGAVVNLDASLATLGDRWRLYGYVRNLMDRTYPLGSTIYSGLLGAEKAFSYASPRTFAIGISHQF